ncbi:hypothetical protein MalM25_28250 [Planctomycetes bacterium MalM25]|nr:hypothetical protein MalM25_28250 [Planctomycetes bacterium MalM25]
MHCCHHCGLEFTHRPAAFTPDMSVVFCTKECREERKASPQLEALPPAFVNEKVEARHRGVCPCCGGEGPLDAHKSYRVSSYVFWTTFETRQTIGCLACGRRRKLRDAARCFVQGWWGIPVGMLATPAMILVNLAAMAGGTRTGQPTVSFRRWVAQELAMQLDAEGVSASDQATAASEAAA